MKKPNNKGLKMLPEKVRNKMGYMGYGGKMKMYDEGGYIPQTKKAKKTYAGENPQTLGMDYYEKFGIEKPGKKKKEEKKKKKAYGGKIEMKYGGKLRDAFTQQYD